MMLVRRSNVLFVDGSLKSDFIWFRKPHLKLLADTAFDSDIVLSHRGYIGTNPVERCLIHLASYLSVKLVHVLDTFEIHAPQFRANLMIAGYIEDCFFTFAIESRVIL